MTITGEQPAHRKARAFCGGRTWLALVVGLQILLLPGAVQAQYTYTTNSAAIAIIGYTGAGGAVTIPSTINGLPVTSIGNYAFDGTSLTSVTISASVTSIGYGAFMNCTSLTSATIPASVNTILDYTFAYCTRLTAITVNPSNSVYSSVDGILFNKSQTTLIAYPGGKAGSYTIPASVTSIGAFTFNGCASLTSVIMPTSVTSIGGSAFTGCTSLTSVTIPASVTSIGGGAFFDCTALTSITIPANVTSIENEAFAYCTSLSAITVDPSNSIYSSAAGVLFNKNQTTLIQCPGGKTGSYTIPNSVTSVGNSAFYGCRLLTSITIPNSVTSSLLKYPSETFEYYTGCTV